VWNDLDMQAQSSIYSILYDHLSSLPNTGDWKFVNSIQDLVHSINEYNTLIGLGRHDAAFEVYKTKL
jgi:hypothetical protein